MINNRQSGRRRGRGGQRAQGGNPGRGQDNGNRIDNRARGNAAQLLEKYKTLARDAQMQGDRVNTEYYLQFADHYFRVLAETRSRFEESQPRRGDSFDQDDGDDFDGNDNGGDDAGDYAPERAAGNGSNGGYRGDDRGNGRGGNGQGNNAGNGRDRDRDGGNANANGNGNTYRAGAADDGDEAPIAPVRGNTARHQVPREYVPRDASDDAPRNGDARPRRGRPRRPEGSGASDVVDAPIALDADRLPPAISVAGDAPAEAEAKPRRRRKVADEATPAG